MNPNEFRVLIKHCYLMGKNIVQAQEWLEKCYRESAPSTTTICQLYTDLKSGRTTNENTKHPGKLKQVLITSDHEDDKRKPSRVPKKGKKDIEEISAFEHKQKKRKMSLKDGNSKAGVRKGRLLGGELKKSGND